jgi:hypothetical protein
VADRIDKMSRFKLAPYEGVEPSQLFTRECRRMSMREAKARSRFAKLPLQFEGLR